MNKLWLFSGQIEHLVGFTKVNKCVSVKAHVSCQNKTDFVLSASLVQFYQVFSIVVVKNNSTLEVFRAKFFQKVT